MKLHEKYIKRCILISKNGKAAAMPNPSVGAVLVVNDMILAEGFTSEFGGNHAEVNAINKVKDTSLLKNATLYVSLEPCSHFGKTPPCADLIIKNKIKNVVVGMLDPNEKVAGNGIKKLVESGINVTVGVLEEECYKANEAFFTFHQKKRPYIILKWAETQDGYIAPNYSDSNIKYRAPIWITNEISRQLVHKWRTEAQVILVGTQTVIADNPKLNVRDWTGKNPVRIVLDQHNRIPKESFIFDNQSQTIILNQQNIDYNKNIAPQIIQHLYEKNIQSVIVEGGTKTLQTFINYGVWDEARVFKGSVIFGKGIIAPKLINYEVEHKKSILDDELLICRNYD